jgi:hypothetical protein
VNIRNLRYAAVYFDGEADHFHMVVKYLPEPSVCVLVYAFTGTSDWWDRLSAARWRPSNAKSKDKECSPVSSP